MPVATITPPAIIATNTHQARYTGVTGGAGVDVCAAANEGVGVAMGVTAEAVSIAVAVGTGVGVAVGAGGGVAVAVGIAVGAVVGVAAGTVVGIAVGAGVGVGVGWKDRRTPTAKRLNVVSVASRCGGGGVCLNVVGRGSQAPVSGL